MVASLLPPSSGPFELAMSLTNMSRVEQAYLKAQILSRLWNPWTCPEAELPLLAWALSVDHWDPSWPVSRRRQVVAESLTYHRRKTTVAGMRMSLGYRDVDLVDYHLPRHGFYCDKPVDPAEQARWIEGLPEIRVYDPAPAIVPGHVPVFAGLDLVADGDARLSRIARLAVGGIETPLSIAPRGAEERIVLPAPDIDVLTVGAAGSRFAAPAIIRDRVLAVRPVTSSDDDFVRPIAAAGDVGTFVKARRRRLAGHDAVMTPVADGGLFVAAPSLAPRGYLAMRLSPEAGRQTGHVALNTVGASRITPAAYEAHWTVHVGRRVPSEAFPEGRLVDASARPRLAEVEDAVRSASALRDQNYLNLRGTRRLTFADLRNVKPGMRFGDRRRIISYA